MTLRLTLRPSASLKVTVPLVLLLFAAVLSTVNMLYHVPRAERAAEEDSRKRAVQEMSRLQSTLEYLSLKGDLVIAQHEIAVLAHNHDLLWAVLADENDVVIAATRRAWLAMPIADVLPQYDVARAAAAVRDRRAAVNEDEHAHALYAYAGVLIGRERAELRPTRSGTLFMAYDLARPQAEARAQVIEQSLYWSGWVIVLALCMWLVFHFLLTRRTAVLVHAAERLAAGDIDARSGLDGQDELGRLGRAFDAMAAEVARTQQRLRDDLAERLRVQRALEDSEARLQQILNNSTAVVSVKDTEGRILFVNRQWERLFHVTQAEALGRSELDVLPDGIAQAQRANDRLVLERNAPIEFEETAQLDDGLHTYITSKFPLNDADGACYAVCGLSTEITEKKRAAEELDRQREALHQREKLAALGSLLAGVAHELNNPLSVVVARAVLLEEQSEPATRNAAVKIRVAAERCARIVRTFLGMARQEPPEQGPVAINDVVTAALDIAAYAVRTSGIEVTLDLSSELPLMLADADQLHQVLLNLIINAQQALQGRDGPRRIRLTTRFDAARNEVRVAVADNGPGIPVELRARVFEPYFTTKPTGFGTGVGLAMSLGLVEAHGGTLTLDCPREGGAVFTMTLPVRAADGVEAEALRPARAAAGRRSVLVVDDEGEIRDLLTQVLADPAHDIVAVGSGRQALERLASWRFDAILTDVRMPGIDGPALYREIERRWPEQAQRVAFLTGDTLSTALRDDVMQTGRPVLDKPFLPADVRRVVAELAGTGDEDAEVQRRAAAN